MKQKVAIFGIIVQLAVLIDGILNKAEDVIVMYLIHCCPPNSIKKPTNKMISNNWV
jgi:hypothetical protein